MNSDLRYYRYNDTLLKLIWLVSLCDKNATGCYYLYCSGEGGSEDGCMIKDSGGAKAVAESVLNEYNTEIYIFTSDTCGWAGCNYVAFEEHSPDNLDVLAMDAYQVATISAFGIFNSARAPTTLHCTYNPETKQYKMEYVYYIVDFYNFPICMMCTCRIY